MDDISALTLWEADKAIIRDKLIQQAAALKRNLIPAIKGQL